MSNLVNRHGNTTFVTCDNRGACERQMWVLHSANRERWWLNYYLVGAPTNDYFYFFHYT
jgi:hypothetical protein